ncbi:MAG: hypothetical protein J6V21_01340 [Alistipes sp.]|jgi:hypothetical protein|nr:hypothetical protein [Alistipes sp.]
MKKLSIFLGALFIAVAMTSCVKPYENTIPLALDGLVVVLPKTLDGKEPIHYAKVTSNGEWIAELETADGSTWCWIDPTRTDAEGNKTPIKGFKVLANYEGSDLVCKVQGSGNLYIPIHFALSQSAHYAKLSVYRTDTGERCTLQLRQ